MKTNLANRRSLLRSLLVLPWLTSLGSRAFAATRTPRATEGPFYPRRGMRFADADNNLVRIDGAGRRAKGEIVVLTGRVLDRSGSPIAGARVEIWQCDANGRYLHTGDRRKEPRDPGFQGFGHVVTDASGAYAFRTIRPVPYPGRTPHIHVKVRTGNTELTTQFYVAGHPQNARDSVYRRLSRKQRKLVDMDFRPGGEWPTADLDIVV